MFVQGSNVLNTTNLNGVIVYYVLVVIDLRGIMDGFILIMMCMLVHNYYNFTYYSCSYPSCSY